jgi:aldose 1-epimerase
MRFSLESRQTGGLSLLVLKDERSGTEVAILPEYGAALHAFSIRLGDEFFNVVENYASAEELKKFLPTSYKSSKLSPFPCRIDQATYVLKGRAYTFKNRFADGTAIHGLLFNKAFSVVSKSTDDEGAEILFSYEYHRDDDGYPFDYTCQVAYRLTKKHLLTVSTTVINRTDVSIPMADGWHPYFRMGAQVDELLLQFNAASKVEFNDWLIPTGNFLPYDEFTHPKKIGSLEFDNCFVLKKELQGPVCRLVNPANKLTLSFFTDQSYPYLQIYIPPSRESIAIENLSAAPDAFNNKLGLIMLEPEASQTFRVAYQLTPD